MVDLSIALTLCDASWLQDLGQTLSQVFNAAEFFKWFESHATYTFVFIFMAVESSFVPFPSEVVVPPAVFLAINRPQTDMNMYVIVLVATLGALVGSLINYFLSMWIGRPVVYAFADSRLGHACLLDRAKVEKAEAYFDKHGAVSTFVGRLIPAVRQLISIPAGLSKMNVGQFCLYTCLGAGLWNIVLAGIGYALAKSVTYDELYAKVEEYNSVLTYIGIGIAVVCVGIILWSALRPRKKADTAA